jgi:hypothetical protein
MRKLLVIVLCLLVNFRADAVAPPESECQQGQIVKAVMEVVKVPSNYATWSDRAKSDDRFSQVVVGMVHLWTGALGDKTNREEGIQWLERAAKQGSLFSMQFLGNFSANDAASRIESRSEIERRSAYWKQQGAALGDMSSERDLGNYFWVGKGVNKDQAEAIRLWILAAEKGSRLAQWNLFVAYSEGQGIPIDLKEAVRWGTLASRSVSGVSIVTAARDKQLKLIASKLSEKELIEARRQAQEGLTHIENLEAAKAVANERECGIREFNKGAIG